jgi:SAM-dependent methyltransferase
MSPETHTLSDPAKEPGTHIVEASTAMLLVGRWHGVTRDQEHALKAVLAEAGGGKLVFVITACEQSRTKRHPLTLEERREVVEGLAVALNRPFEIHGVSDISDSSVWVEHLKAVVKDESEGATELDPATAVLISSNPDVLGLFGKHGFKSLVPSPDGTMPADLHAAIRTGSDWKEIASDSTVAIFEKRGLVKVVHGLFEDVLLTDDGELSHGRDFKVYAAGMDASLSVKIEDVCPHIKRGRIVDKGCGTGALLIHLSTLFPDSEIVGMDLSSELLRTSEGQFFPNQNVSIVRGNIIHQRFRSGTVSTIILSSVMHEVYSYNGYDRDQVRLALANARKELELGGRVIIRDGIKPNFQGKVWMRCDAESEERFRRFAREFKNKSNTPGVPFEEKRIGEETWFYLDLHGANEFLSKKDYLANWEMEVNEEFGVFTLDEWQAEFEKQGYRIRECRSYLNQWIAEHRYCHHVWLHADDDGKPGAALPYPDTTAIIVAEAI